VITRGDKFAAITLYHTTANLKASVDVSDRLSFHPHLPFDISPNWEKWLGTLRSKEVLEANLILLATLPSSNPTVLDSENQKLEQTVTTLFFALLVLGVPSYSSINRITGAHSDGSPEVRQVSRISDYYVCAGNTPLEVLETEARQAKNIFDCLKLIHADPKKFVRLKRGFNAFLKAIEERQAYDRIHQFVRSLEVLIMAEPGKSKAQFRHRCQTFAVSSSHPVNEILDNFYEMRSRVEHLGDLDDVFPGLNESERDKLAHYRVRQVEAMARHVYLQILTNSSLREHYATRETLINFWKLKDDKRIRLWPRRFDLDSVRPERS